MPKMKTNKAVAKRVRVTARGKVMCNRSGAGHLKSVKSPSRIRRFRKSTEVSSTFAKVAKRMMAK